MAEAFLTGQSGKKLVGNATTSDVLSGKTFSNKDSNKLTGTMTNRGKVDHQLAINGTYTIPQGYHNGTGSVFQSVTTKGSQTFTPGTSNQTISANQYLTGIQTILGDANLVASNIKAGIKIFGVTGTSPIPGGTAGAAQILAGYTFINSQGVEVTGTIPSKSSATYTPGTSPQTIAAGQYLSGAQTIEGDADLISANIKSGVNIFGVAGKASVVDTTGTNAVASSIKAGETAYVNGIKITGTLKTMGPNTSSEVTLAYKGRNTNNDSALFSLNGLPPGSFNNEVLVRTAYNASPHELVVSDAISGVSASNIKAGETIMGVTGTFTSDGTLWAPAMLQGQHGYSNGVLVSGTMINRSAENVHQPALEVSNGVYTPGNNNIRTYFKPPDGHYNQTWVAVDNPDLIPGNILAGKNILGVAGGIPNYSTSVTGTYTYAVSTKGDGGGSLVMEPLTGYYESGVNQYGFGSIIARDTNYVAENIKAGVNIFGVTGTYVPLAGYTWTQRTGSFGTETIYGVAYGRGTFVAVSTGSRIATSLDGINWTPRVNSFGGTIIYDVCYGHGMFVAVGASSKLATSVDGITWVQRTANFGSSIRSICYGQGMFVAASVIGQIATSTDGINWTVRTSSFGSSSIMCVDYGQGVFVAVGASGKLATSLDGITWTPRTGNLGSSQIWGVSYGRGIFVIVGDSGLATSLDGVTWTKRTSSFGSKQIFGVNYGQGMFVAVSAGLLATSTDGINWTQRESSFGTTAIYGVCYGQGTFVAVGASGKIATSNNAYL